MCTVYIYTSTYADLKTNVLNEISELKSNNYKCKQK